MVTCVQLLFAILHVKHSGKKCFSYACGSFQECTLIISHDGEKYFLAIKMATQGQKQPHAGKTCVNTQLFRGMWYVFFGLLMGNNCGCPQFIHLLRWSTLELNA